MAASKCYGCSLPILGDSVEHCVFCPKQFHANCSLSAKRLDNGIVCNFGCRQAFDAGFAAAQRQRACHTCKQCGKSFAKNCNLHAHIRSAHLNQRFGPCPCCDPALVFTTKQDLKRHLQAQREKTVQQLQEEGKEQGGDLSNCTESTQGAPLSPSLALLTTQYIANMVEQQAIHSSPAATTPRTL